MHLSKISNTMNYYLTYWFGFLWHCRKHWQQLASWTTWGEYGMTLTSDNMTTYTVYKHVTW